ncbi:MAG: hypothetical protein A2097_08530 [Desulfobacula sp. GWF2_41_7]|nr:MAG: hypothetical protein A2097_08530 [Desulfobacula sp. GWF2_41_7]
MNLYFRIILILLSIAYLVSPVDVIPDFMIPFIGFIDDGIIIIFMYYLIRYGTLPPFLFKKKKPFKNYAEQKFNHSKSRTRKSGSGKKENTSEQNTAKTPYVILDIKPGASKKEITAAYKEAVKKYHPDKLSHLGEEFSSLANEKFLEIQKAYDTLMKS